MTTRKFPPIFFSARQVALMIQIAAAYHPGSIEGDTGHTRRELRAMAAQRIPPSPSILKYFRLKRRGSVLAWDPALEWKNDPCWGPCMRSPDTEVLKAGQAIHLGVRTVELSFTTGRPRFVR